jgi:hypothetical protein
LNSGSSLLFYVFLFLTLSNLSTMEKTQLIGRRIRINHMEDMSPVPDGTKGIITGIDDIGQIQVRWDNGSSLSVIEEIDDYDIID